MSGSVTHSIEAQRYTNDRTSYTTSVDASTLDETSAVSTRSSTDYTVNISEEAQTLLDGEHTKESKPQADSSDIEDDGTDTTNSNELTEEEQNKVAELTSRDQEVRTHEQAHAAAGGQYAGSPSYEYEQGPNGKRYAVEGEVQIDVSPIANNAQATIEKMKQIYRAALAPSEPSAADRAVAREAQTNIAEATATLAQENTQLSKNNSEHASTTQNRGVISNAENNQFSADLPSRQPLNLIA